MKSNLKLILITLGFAFAFSAIISTSLNFNSGANDKSSEYVNLKNSAVSGKIHIIGNSGWLDFRNDGKCTGEGTYSEPYLIKDLVINGGSSGSCIWIENSDVFFKIENCTVFNAQGPYPHYEAGIKLSSVSNGKLINNNCSFNEFDVRCSGIYLNESDFNIISGNRVERNELAGIYIRNGFYNTISGNIAITNVWAGIHITGGYNNTVLENTAIDNDSGITLESTDYNLVSGNIIRKNYEGIILWESDFNIIIGNKLSDNRYCINVYSGENNIIRNNSCGNDQIPGYNLFFLITIIPFVVIFISTKLKRQKVKQAKY